MMRKIGEEDGVGNARAGGFEDRDAEPRLIGYAAAALVGGIGFSALFVAALLWIFAQRPQPVRPVLAGILQQTPPLPHLEISPSSDRVSIEAAAKKQLEGYAWVDRSEGRVRIPIELAIRSLAKSGWPDPKGIPAP